MADEQASREYINQMWAEAMEIYRSGNFRLRFSPAMNDYLKAHQKDFMPEDTKAKQFGFCMQLDEDEKLTCCGDEPYNELEQKYAENSTWLLHEAFCLYGQADEFKPYEKHHSTVKDACEMAADLNVENLILYHTEDKNIEHRQELYLEEGKAYYDGNLFVPDDLDVIEL